MVLKGKWKCRVALVAAVVSGTICGGFVKEVPAKSRAALAITVNSWNEWTAAMGWADYGIIRA